MVPRRGKGIAVAAIDFGTTYSGYAYTFNADYKDDHTKVTQCSYHYVCYNAHIFYIIFHDAHCMYVANNSCK